MGITMFQGYVVCLATVGVSSGYTTTLKCGDNLLGALYCLQREASIPASKGNQS